ncbi:hypothetical protein GOODEAATRI_001768 [Goodea atripinnis]|uniref:C2H2-type domain-containing protein n=1 Tax=Goodea atripinnis TaxID=208336 RepID=A0ABV0NGP7_9TELE
MRARYPIDTEGIQTRSTVSAFILVQKIEELFQTRFWDLAMGDMKTPDFDDLLAAFDIPDIDAQEAIQSNPSEQRDAGVTNAPGGSKSGTSSCFPNSEPPVVSVIVKNTVRSESLEEEERSARDKTDNPSSSALASQVPVKLEDFTSQLEPKLPANAAMEPQITNGFEEAQPINQGQASTQPWPEPPSFSSTLSDNEGDEGAEPTTDVINSLSPLLYSQSSTVAGAIPSSPRSPPSLTPQPSLGGKPVNPSSPPLQRNGSMTDETKCVADMDEDESDPDFESPLVIQESPESMMASPPKRKRLEKLHSDLPQMYENAFSLLPQPPNLSAKPKSPKEEREQPFQPISSSTAPQPQTPSSIGTNPAVPKEEKYPEHVIDERESPESPPPSETGLLLNRSSSPDLGLASDPDLNQEKVLQKEPHAEAERREENRSEETEDVGEKMMADREKSKENFYAGSEHTETPSPPRPLKVKIKMPTGSITRTVTNLAPKRITKASMKDAESLKPSPENQTVKSKRKLQQQTDLPTATRAGVSTVKEKKQRVSPTAVSITKTATLPSVSPPPSRANPGAINLRSLGQKTLNSGITLPAPLAPQTSSRPASIVNNTGAIISKSQTSLVEAFNKILNNKNLLPSYKPDLSSPVPVEWGISLPAQGYRCLECGDAFALEQSLAQHYGRRSLRIEVTCNHCAKRLAFFNKCSLLLHAREHKEKGLIMHALLPCSCPTAAVQQHISESTKAPRRTSAQSAGAPPSSSCFKNTCRRPACTFLAALATEEEWMDKEKVETERMKAPTVWKCRSCNSQFTEREEYIAHMGEQHGKGADEADSSSEQDNSLVARKRRRAAVKTEDGEATDRKSPVKKLRSSSSAPAPYTPPESGFSCAPCGFTTEDSPAFLEHISQHRRGGTEGGGLQCLQCGACFTSTSSLSRHRFIIHKVKDAFSDSQQILSVPLSPSAGNIKNHDDRSSLNGSEPASPSSQSLASQGKEEDGPLACKVCGKHFEKATDLNTHFRTHGMAFIIARNAGKTT